MVEHQTNNNRDINEDALIDQLKQCFLDNTVNPLFSIAIPIKVDSLDRLINFLAVIKYIKKYLDADIVIGESAEEPKLSFLSDYCRYFYEDFDGCFHKTKILNHAYELCDTEIVVSCDADVLLPLRSYETAYNLLSESNIDAVIPYTAQKNVIEVPPRIRDQFLETLSIDDIEKADLEPRHFDDYESVGGIFFFRKEKFKSIGYENPKFKFWGYEDDERYIRFLKFGYQIERIDAPLYHFSHPRHKDVSKECVLSHFKNRKEFEYVKRLDNVELLKYIKSWQTQK